MDFKIITPHTITDPLNDNIDINVILPSGEVYFATIFTVLNIQTLLEESENGYFYCADMLVVKELTAPLIRTAIQNVIEDGVIELVLSKIGDIATVLPGTSKYEQIVDFGFKLKT